MGKVLIAAFDDKDEIAFDELLLFLKSNSHIKAVSYTHLMLLSYWKWIGRLRRVTLFICQM